MLSRLIFIEVMVWKLMTVNKNIRTQLLHQLEKEVRRLPNGLLMRLVKDAADFNAWNLSKKSCRQKGRLAQHESWKRKAEAAYQEPEGDLRNL